MIRLSAAFLVLSFLFLSCSSQKPAGKNETNNPDFPLTNTVITGKLVEIINTQNTYDKSSPCSKVPCDARIEVLTIEQRGKDYHGQFAVGDFIEVHFTFTTGAATKELFPNLDVRYPGVKDGKPFRAVITYNESKKPKYTITEYTIL